MPKVKYVGPMDSRELTAADFKRLGVEEGAKKMTFQKGEEVQVDGNIAEALTHDLLGKDFEVVQSEPIDGESPTDNPEGSPESDTDGGNPAVDKPLTKAQQAKVDKAAKAGADSVAKKDALSPEAEVEQGGHPQATDTTGESTGATTATTR
jgi:hypothetical protein